MLIGITMKLFYALFRYWHSSQWPVTFIGIPIELVSKIPLHWNYSDMRKYKSCSSLDFQWMCMHLPFFLIGNPIKMVFLATLHLSKYKITWFIGFPINGHTLTMVCWPIGIPIGLVIRIILHWKDSDMLKHMSYRS